MVGAIWYPSVEDVLAIHDDIVEEYSKTHAGVRSRGDIEFALDYIEGETGGTAPETIHEKAFHLFRLLVVNHPFVDANKRTALNTTAVFYFLNGYRLKYDNEIRSILSQLGTDQEAVDQAAIVSYLQSHTEEIDLADEIGKWRDDLVQYGLTALTDNDSGDPND